MADDRVHRLKKSVQETADTVKNVKSLRLKIIELSKIIEASGRYAADLAKINLPGEPLLDDLKEELKKLQEFGSILERQLAIFGQKLDIFEKFVKEKFSGKREIALSDIQEFCEKLIATYNTSDVSLTNLNNFIGCLSDSQLLAQKLEDERGETLREKLKQQSEEMDKKASSSRNWAPGAAGTVGLVALGAAALGFFTGGAAWVAAGAAWAGAGAVAGYTVLSVKEMRRMAADIREKSNKLQVIAKELEADVNEAIRVNGEATLVLQSVLEFFSKDELIAQQQEQIAQQQEQIAQQQEEIARLKEQSKQQGKI